MIPQDLKKINKSNNSFFLKHIIGSFCALRLNKPCLLSAWGSASVFQFRRDIYCGGFCDSKSNKIRISLHTEVLPFLNLLSATLNPCVPLQGYQGDTAALSHTAAVETADLMCPDAEHAAVASGASCKATPTIWAEKEDSSGAAGLLLGDRSPLS